MGSAHGVKDVILGFRVAGRALDCDGTSVGAPVDKNGLVGIDQLCHRNRLEDFEVRRAKKNEFVRYHVSKNGTPEIAKRWNRTPGYMELTWRKTMQPQAKWFFPATAMAFLALVALFVSPVLALGCCCGSSLHPSVLSVASTSHHGAGKAAHGCCAEEEAAEHHAGNNGATNQDCSVVKSVCSCDSAVNDQPFVAADSSVFSSFAPVFATLPVSPFVFQCVKGVRLAPTTDHAVWPRSADRSAHSGRAPPALALS